VEEMRNDYTVLVCKLKGEKALENLGIDVTVILKWILEK
jgi:hypothetical protein